MRWSRRAVRPPTTVFLERLEAPPRFAERDARGGDAGRRAARVVRARYAGRARDAGAALAAAARPAWRRAAPAGRLRGAVARRARAAESSAAAAGDDFRTGAAASDARWNAARLAATPGRRRVDRAGGAPGRPAARCAGRSCASWRGAACPRCGSRSVPAGRRVAARVSLFATARSRRCCGSPAELARPGPASCSSASGSRRARSRQLGLDVEAAGRIGA